MHQWQERNGSLELLKKAKQEYDSIVKFFVDGGYSGKLQDQCFLETGALLTIAKRVTDKGFEVIPKRWIVERTFAWLSNFRRMHEEYEKSCKTSKTNIFFNMITIMVKRLVN